MKLKQQKWHVIDGQIGNQLSFQLGHLKWKLWGNIEIIDVQLWQQILWELKERLRKQLNII